MHLSISRRIVPGQLLVMSWKYEGPLESNPAETQLTFRFGQQDDGIAELVLKEEGINLDTVDRRNTSRYKWTVALAEMESLL